MLRDLARGRDGLGLKTGYLLRKNEDNASIQDIFEAGYRDTCKLGLRHICIPRSMQTLPRRYAIQYQAGRYARHPPNFGTLYIIGRRYEPFSGRSGRRVWFNGDNRATFHCLANSSIFRQRNGSGTKLFLIAKGTNRKLAWRGSKRRPIWNSVCRILYSKVILICGCSGRCRRFRGHSIYQKNEPNMYLVRESRVVAIIVPVLDASTVCVLTDGDIMAHIKEAC